MNNQGQNSTIFANISISFYYQRHGSCFSLFLPKISIVTQFILKREPEANKNLNSNRFFINELMYAIVLISFIALVRY